MPPGCPPVPLARTLFFGKRSMAWDIGVVGFYMSGFYIRKSVFRRYFQYYVAGLFILSAGTDTVFWQAFYGLGYRCCRIFYDWMLGLCKCWVAYLVKAYLEDIFNATLQGRSFFPLIWALLSGWWYIDADSGND